MGEARVPGRPLLVGECNPYGSHSEFALWPDPPYSAGGRLCLLIMRLDTDVYCESFDRANLCAREWRISEARARARELEAEDAGRTIVLLGSKVCAAFGAEFAPFQTIERIPGLPRLVVLPHPSGINRMWSQPGSLDRARETLRAAGVLPAGSP
jgi:hypothetical protein